MLKNLKNCSMSVVVADTGVLISLGYLQQFKLIEKIFGEVYIPIAVWNELNNYKDKDFNKNTKEYFKQKVKKITSNNFLSPLMDLGESESVMLYEEISANYLLVDDLKARIIAESLNVNCIGTLGLLMIAKQKGLVKELKPLFQILRSKERFYTVELLNKCLLKVNESPL